MLVRHPGIVIKDGPTGRRAALEAGPDVWEVAKAARDARATMPAASPAELIKHVATNSGLSDQRVRLAIDYWTRHRDEIDAELGAADRAEEEFVAAQDNYRALLGDT